MVEMRSFQPKRLRDLAVPVSTTWLLGGCMEARGKQDLWLQQEPEILEALRQEAIVQSAESSNRLEGTVVDARRLRPLLLAGAVPRDRSEEEVLGYRRALDWVFTSGRSVRLNASVLCRLHELAQGAVVGDAGRFKERDNEIIEMLPDGERRVRFRPTPATETPNAIEQLTLAYRQVRDQRLLPVLLAIGSCVFDLLCVHPFRDGNGRVSRLLAALLLGQEGFEVARYVSLERLIEQSKAEYYEALGRSSEGWHEAEHNLTPWWNYFLSILHQAYRELARRVERASGATGKTALVRQAVLRQLGAFRLADLRASCPCASDALVRKVLSRMKAEGQVVLSGRGRGARWSLVERKRSSP